MNRLSLVVLSFILIAVGCDAGSSSSKKHKSGYAPDFTLPALSSTETFRLKDQVKSSPVLLSFWATWCPSCIEKMATLNEWQEEFGASHGLKILGVNVQESRNRIQTFIGENPVKFPILLDEDGDVSSEFGITELPVTVLLAKGGKILYYGFSLPTDIKELMAKG